MKCPAPLPEEAQTPQLVALLAEEPYRVPVKEKKGEPKKKEGLRIRGPSGARSGDTHISSALEGEEEKEEEKEDEKEDEAEGEGIFPQEEEGGVRGHWGG